MKVFVGYASTEGQTRKIARHMADRLVDAGHSVELLALRDALDDGPDHAPGDFDRAILAASVHAGHYQRPLAAFVEMQRDWLSARPTLFVSVSLAAAGHDAEDWRSLDEIGDDFCEATGWTPGEVLQVAGAYRPSQYDLFRRFIMRRIIAEKDPDADTGEDKEYTDWAALDAALEAWIAA